MTIKDIDVEIHFLRMSQLREMKDTQARQPTVQV